VGMGRRNVRGKPDKIQSNIVEELRSIPGISVYILSMYPRQLDLLVGWRGRTYWYEVKNDEKGEPTRAEREILAGWTGHAKLVWSSEMILEDIDASD